MHFRWVLFPVALLTTSPLTMRLRAQKPAEWQPHPDAVERAEVPHGSVEVMPPWESRIFENTVRDWAVYVPAQYQKGNPTAVMVFQDGHDYWNPKGHWRVPVVFDNLIARGAMPVTIAVFVNPGHNKYKEVPKSPWLSSNRSPEYDSLGDRYARFLTEEILPEVAKRYTLSTNPEMRAVAGASSGGICAFTVAWERPDAFRKVFSSIGSFTNLRGGNVYPSLIRKTEPKPLRVCIADTSGDVDNAAGSWPISNQLMAAALKHMGYDTRFDWAEGYGHSSQHAAAIFPESMQWLWRREKEESLGEFKGRLGGDMPILRMLIPGQHWEVVAENIGFADGPCSDSEGNFYFSDLKAPAVFKVAATGGPKTLLSSEPASGLKFGPDGLLYACQGAKKRVVSIDPTSGIVREIASGVAPNDLAVSSDGFLYFTETGSQKITRINLIRGGLSVVDQGVASPNGIVLSPDGGTLAVSEYKGENVWTYRVSADGSLDAKMPTMRLRLPIDPKGEFKQWMPPPFVEASQADGMTVDKVGRYYVTSAVGVQIFDPTGRLSGVLAKPIETKPLTSCTMAGPNHEYLYVTHGDTVLRRRLKLD